MIILRCDLCKKEATAFTLEGLKECFTTKKVKHVCIKCRDIINNFKSNIEINLNSMVTKAVKEFIEKISNDVKE